LHSREIQDTPVETANGQQETKPVWRFLGNLVFYGLLVVIALTAIPYGTVEEWWVAFFECAVFALGALWFAAGLIKSDWRAPASRLLWPLLALALFIALQTVNFGGGGSGAADLPGALRGAISADVYETRLVLLKLLAMMLSLVLLLRYTDSHRRLRVLIYVVIGVGVVSALFGILRQTTHHNSPATGSLSIATTSRS
jgi:hypothetical protein